MLKQKTTGSFMSLDANTLVGVHNNNSEHLRSTYCMPDIVLSSFHVLTHFIPQQPYEVCSIIIPSLQMSHPEVKELAQHLTAIHSVMSSKPDSMSFTTAQFCFSHGAFPNTSNSLRLQQKPSSGCPEPSLLQQIWQALSTTQKKKNIRKALVNCPFLNICCLLCVCEERNGGNESAYMQQKTNFEK